MTLKIFTSHSHKDYQNYTEELLQKLKDIPDVDILIDLSSIHPSEPIRDNINAMISAADLVLIILTENSGQSREVYSELLKAHDNRKKIIALVDESLDSSHIPYFLWDEEQIRFNADNFYEKLDKLSAAVKNYTCELAPWPNYLGFNLKEYQFIPLLFTVFGLLILCNIGAGLWWGLDKIFTWTITALGTRLTGFPEEPSLSISLKAYYPAIWGAIANLGIFVSALFLVRYRFKTFWMNANEMIRASLLLILFFSLGAILFYNGGVDKFLKNSNLEIKNIELLSTASWSIILSLSTIIPIMFLRLKVFDSVDRESLPWCVVTTFIFALLFLFGYFIFCPTNDQLRGIIVGTGMRFGLFLGLYYSFIRGPLKAKYTV